MTDGVTDGVTDPSRVWVHLVCFLPFLKKLLAACPPVCRHPSLTRRGDGGKADEVEQAHLELEPQTFTPMNTGSRGPWTLGGGLGAEPTRCDGWV